MVAKKEMDSITLRIEKIRQRTGLSRRAFCAKVGFSYARYHHLSGVRRARPPVDLLTAVVEKLGVNIEWIFSGQGSISNSHKKFIPIPFYRTEKQIAAEHAKPKSAKPKSAKPKSAKPKSAKPKSANLSSENHSPEKDGEIYTPSDGLDQSYIALHDEWIKRELGFQAKQLVCTSGQGDAMTPTIQPGDIMLIGCQLTPPYPDGIYLLFINKALLLKRLQFLPNNIVRVSGDNHAYQPFEASLQDNGDINILGRVLWIFHKY